MNITAEVLHIKVEREDYGELYLAKPLPKMLRERDTELNAQTTLPEAYQDGFRDVNQECNEGIILITFTEKRTIEILSNDLS